MIKSTSPLRPDPSDLVEIRTLTIPDDVVLGLRFHRVTMKDTLDILNRFIQDRIPRQVCLVNAYTIALCQKDPVLKGLINRSDLVLADGMSIIWGGRWLGSKLPERVAGPDLMLTLCEEAERKGYRIFLMGSSLDNLVELKMKLLVRYPGLLIDGMYSPPVCERVTEEETLTILNRLQATKTDILFVGLSAPKQEKWIADNLHRIGVPVSVGVGAAFDFLSGRIPRAPVYLQVIGLEWLYRLYREPRRLWKRYLLGNAVFLSRLLGQLIRLRFSSSSIAGR